jgi:hypothetical protein
LSIGAKPDALLRLYVESIWNRFAGLLFSIINNIFDTKRRRVAAQGLIPHRSVLSGDRGFPMARYQPNPDASCRSRHMGDLSGDLSGASVQVCQETEVKITANDPGSTENAVFSALATAFSSLARAGTVDAIRPGSALKGSPTNQTL